MFSFIVCNTNEVKSPLVDARFQVESGTWANGITVAYAASVYSDFLRSAVIFCTDYWLTRSFRLPRPASPASTSKVETVHPQDLKCFHTYNLEKKKRISYPLFNCQLLEQEARGFNSYFLRGRDYASKIEVSKLRYAKCKTWKALFIITQNQAQTPNVSGNAKVRTL